MRLEITRRADLAVRALVALAERGDRMKGAELAATIGATPGFLPQAVQPLVRAGWVASDPGPTGGYRALVALDDVSVLSVVEAVEGPTDQGRCVVTGGACAVHGTCAMHTAWARARDVLLETLGSLPLAAVTDPTEPGAVPAEAPTTRRGPRP